MKRLMRSLACLLTGHPVEARMQVGGTPSERIRFIFEHAHARCVRCGGTFPCVIEQQGDVIFAAPRRWSFMRW